MPDSPGAAPGPEHGQDAMQLAVRRVKGLLAGPVAGICSRLVTCKQCNVVALLGGCYSTHERGPHAPRRTQAVGAFKTAQRRTELKQAMHAALCLQTPLTL